MERAAFLKFRMVETVTTKLPHIRVPLVECIQRSTIGPRKQKKIHSITSFLLCDKYRRQLKQNAGQCLSRPTPIYKQNLLDAIYILLVRRQVSKR